MNPFQQNKKKPVYTNDSILESLRGLSSGVGKTVKNEVTSNIPTDILSSLLGTPKSGNELRPNQSVDLNPERIPVPSYARPELIHRAPVRLEEKGLEQKINAVRQELAALAVAVKSLNTEIEKAVMEMPVQPGVYHLNFFERLKSVLKSLRQNIEDSRTWLSMWTSRKKQKGYWGSYKKHGTSFGLSNERTAATSAG